MKVEGLDEGEALVAWMPLSFAGSSGTSIRGAFSLSPGKIRRKATKEWLRAADACGFPAPTGDLVIGLSSDTRLHVWRPQFWVARPGRHAGWFPCSRIAQVGVARHGTALRLTFLIDDGTLLGFESLKARRLRSFAAQIEGALER